MPLKSRSVKTGARKKHFNVKDSSNWRTLALSGTLMNIHTAPLSICPFTINTNTKERERERERKEKWIKERERQRETERERERRRRRRKG